MHAEDIVWMVARFELGDRATSRTDRRTQTATTFIERDGLRHRVRKLAELRRLRVEDEDTLLIRELHTRCLVRSNRRALLLRGMYALQSAEGGRAAVRVRDSTDVGGAVQIDSRRIPKKYSDLSPTPTLSDTIF